MRIKVEFPVLSNRIVKDYMEKIESGKYSEIAIKTLVCKIRVYELTCDENDQSALHIEYSEDYISENTFSSVIGRAEDYARNYYKKLGLGAE